MYRYIYIHLYTYSYSNTYIGVDHSAVSVGYYLNHLLPHMFIFIYSYTYMYIDIYTYTYIYLYTYIHMLIYLYIYRCWPFCSISRILSETFITTYIYIYIFMFICICNYSNIYICIPMYMCMYNYKHKYTNIGVDHSAVSVGYYLKHLLLDIYVYIRMFILTEICV
jgi:hypothetical protein